MYQYKRMIVGMNMNDKDSVLVQEALRFSEVAGIEKRYFIHVLGVQEIPEKIRKTYPQLTTSFQELSEDKMKKMILENSRKNVEFECHLVEGKPVRTMLEQIKKLDADVLVIGRKYSNNRGSRKTAESIARKAPCSVYIVPSESNFKKIEKILISSDGSSHSKNALEEAVMLAKSLNLSSVLCLNVYHVPMGYHSTGKSFEEFAEIMLSNARAEFSEMIEGFDAKGIEIKPLFELNDNVEKGIQDVIKKENVDILVIGARGRSRGASILLGSVTEHLIGHVNVPLLAVKNKSEGIAFLDAMLDIL